MNNKGQVLTLFVLLLPILMILFAFIFDSSYIVRENSKLDDIAYTSLEYLNSSKDLETVKEYILKNNKDIEIVTMTNEKIDLIYKLKPIFGKVVGCDYYNLEACYEASFVDGVLRIEEKG